MKNILKVLLFISSCISSNAFAKSPESIITLPVNVNLIAVQNKINQSIPQHIETIDMNNHKCVDAEWMKTNGIPHCSFRHFKLHCHSSKIKIKITPSISCDVDGSIDRSGDIKIVGSGASIAVTVPIKASVTAKGRGAIGKNIQQTVRAETEITALLTPTVDENWNIKVAVDTNYRWTKRPEIKLFNLIPVTVSSHIDPILKKELSKLETSLPNILKEAKLKETVKKAWVEVQKPILVDKKTNTYFLFDPTGLGFSQINITNNILQASFNISGYPKILAGKNLPKLNVKTLPKLKTIKSTEPKIFVDLPIKVEYKEVEKQANVFLKDSEPFNLEKHGYKGVLKLSDISFVKKNNNLKLEVNFRINKNKGWLNKIDVFGWFDVKGTVTFSLKPKIDSIKNIIYMTNFSLDSDTNNNLADILLKVANLPPIRSRIEKSLNYNFNNDVNIARTQLTQILNKKISSDISLSGNISSLTIRKIQINEKTLEIPIQVVGTTTVNIGI